ncbi:hypothetical protein UY3_11832 [Chelonia mydas]|uniref:Uncharacterized protein n=1 Tax=Chelonia mydas TaxID=8469 RepID=M7B675_CHEMY|nr:hypothetical protein UY3_11832 [Chelonia mydas]
MIGTRCRPAISKELDAIHSSDPTSTSPVDTLEGMEPGESGPNPEDEITDEEVEKNDYVEPTELEAKAEVDRPKLQLKRIKEQQKLYHPEKPAPLNSKYGTESIQFVTTLDPSHTLNANWQEVHCSITVAPERPDKLTTPNTLLS